MPNEAGKGDSYRKVDQNKFDRGWDRTFSQEFKTLREKLDLLECYRPNKINLFRLKYESITTKDEAKLLTQEVELALVTA